jgi:hypothetical protein
MATLIVMDRTGDTRHNFDAKNADTYSSAFSNEHWPRRRSR